MSEANANAAKLCEIHIYKQSEFFAIRRCFVKFRFSGRKSPKTPPVKKASHYIAGRSHRPKRYISLMLVPSYSGGKTRSLQLPRHIFIGILIVMLLVTLSIAGFYLRSAYHRSVAENLSIHLYETQEALTDVLEETIRLQDEITDSVNQLYEQHQEERRLQERRHMYALDDIWDLIEEIEERIDDLRGERINDIGEMQLLSFIPAVAESLEIIEAVIDELGSGLDQGFATIGMLANPSDNSRQTEIMSKLLLLEEQLQIEEILQPIIYYHRQSVSLYITNYPTIRPVEGAISSDFAMRTTVFNPRLHMHYGVDIPAPMGTPILATGGGRVVFSGWLDGFGTTVIIDHGIDIQTLYAHNSRNLVRVGDEVERGQYIALVGSTGQSTGPHVHYEVRIDGVHVNPNYFFLTSWER